MFTYRQPRRWYALSFDGDSADPAIEVLVHKPLMGPLSRRFATSVRSTDLMRTFKCNEFQTDLSQGFGLQNMFEIGKGHPRYHVLRLSLTKDRSQELIAANLACLIRTLTSLPEIRDFDLVTDDRMVQLITIDANYTPNQLGGAGVSGWLSPHAVEWIRAIAQITRHLRPVERAMWLAKNAISEFKAPAVRDGPYPYPGLDTIIEPNGRFSFDCPAANGVSTDYTWKGGDSPQPFSPSNMDGPGRLIVIIAALAAFHDLLNDS